MRGLTALALALALGSCFALGIAAASSASADEGWTIERFHAEIVIRPDGSLRITETIDVAFGTLERHGIFREIPVRYRYDAENDRVYGLTVRNVTDAAGRRWPFERSERGANAVIRIGDPDRTVTGRQTYRILYDVDGALNAFPDHDELFWNVNGTWPVPSIRVSATVRLERSGGSGGGTTRSACFEGPAGSTVPCRTRAAPAAAEFDATRPLGLDEQLTIVAGFPRGLVAEPRPRLVPKERGPEDMFDVTPSTVGGAGGVLGLGLAAIGARWLVAGRDRRYLKRYYLDPTSAQTVAGPFDRDTIVPEYEPPELLRPAQVGLLLDESADPKDLTATIVDLAVRGYLFIEEIPSTGLFGKRRDWTLRKRKPADAPLAAYERRIFDRLFESGEEVMLSSLRGTFHGTLWEAQKELYRDAVSRSWFGVDPFWTRVRWQVAGAVTVLGGLGLMVLLGLAFGAGIVGLAVAALGVALFGVSRAMPSRTARGRELLLRILGFRRYMETAETERQRFAERENIFADYLPYAIVFGSVTKWARAFSGLDAQRATQGWYSGVAVTNVATFTNDLASMSSSVSSAISSTPPSSGFSGGGSAGGGGGGGGGGSW
jgi:hypothetical protein